MNLSRRQLELFLAVAATRNLARASDRVALSPSAFTRALQLLEAQLGVVLFERNTRRAVLTEAGERFLPVARRLLSDIDEALCNLRGGQQELSGVVSVATGSAFGGTALPPAIKRFVALHPRVQLRLVDANSQGITERVQRGEVDIGIATVVGPADGVVARPLLHAALGLLLPPGVRRPGSAAAAGLPFALVKEAEDTSIMQLLRSRAPDWAESMAGGVEVSSLSLQLELVRAGVGATVLSALGASHPQARGLRFLPLEPPVERLLMLLRRRDRPLRPAAAALSASVRDALPGVGFDAHVRLAEGLDRPD